MMRETEIRWSQYFALRRAARRVREKLPPLATLAFKLEK